MRTLVLVSALRIERPGDFAHVFGGMEKVDQLAIGVLLQETPIGGRTVGDAQVERVGEALLGACDLALQALLELTFSVGDVPLSVEDT